MVFLSDPFETLLNLQDALQSALHANWLETSPSGTGAYPPINVFRKGDDIVVIAEVPGIRKSDIDIQVHGNALRITGTKSLDHSDKASVHRRERLAGRFDRAITIPVEIDADKVKAECRDGILALYLPRAERDKPRSIKLS